MTENPRASRTAGAVIAKQRTSDQKKAAAKAAIDSLLASGTEVTLSGVAREANVSRPFLYEHFNDQIAEAQARQAAQRAEGVAVARPARHPAADDSLRADLHLTNEENARLKADNDNLRRQLRQDVGARVEQRLLSADDRVVAKQQEIETLRSAVNVAETNVKVLRRQVQRLEADLAAERRAHSQTAALVANDDSENVVPLR